MTRRRRSIRFRRALALAAVLPVAALAMRAGAGTAAGARPPVPDALAAVAQTAESVVHLPLVMAMADGDWPPPPRLPTASPSASAPAATPLPSATPPTPTAIPADFAPFGLVHLAPDRLLDGSGTTVDSIAFWEAPDPADSLMLVTAKGNQRVEVWRAPFADGELPALQHPSFGSGSRVNGVVVDPAADRLYVSVSRPASTVAAFALPGLAFERSLVDGAVDLRSEPNLALLTRPDGSKVLYVSADDRVYAYDPASGAALGDFAPAAPLETMLADDFHQLLYIPDEVRHGGVYAYHPDGRPYERGGRVRFGDDGVFQADAEGIALYRCPADGARDDGRGWLIVADQRSGASDFELFDRRSWAHLGRVQLDGVAFSDGIASTQQALPGYPAGAFAAANDDRDVAIVGWEALLAATGLRCD